jgi:Ca2+-binding EF-hand superfamily protein
MITIRQLISVLLLAILSIGAASADDKEKSTASADATFKSLDRDTDERLSKSEAAGDKMLSEHFTAVDADSDGYLTKREYTAHMKEMKSHAPKQDQ